jgi:hypothetical protein
MTGARRDHIARDLLGSRRARGAIETDTMAMHDTRT